MSVQGSCRRLALLWAIAAAIAPVPAPAAESGRIGGRAEERRPAEDRFEESGRFASGGRTRTDLEQRVEVKNRNRMDALNEGQYDAYRRERAGEVVGTRFKDSKPYDHRMKVRNAQRGMENDLRDINSRIRYLGTSGEEAARLKVMAKDMERVIKESWERTGQTQEEAAELDRKAKEQSERISANTIQRNRQ